MFVPYPDVIATALQTQAARLASVRWCHIGNDATHYDVLDGLAVRARHRRNLLMKESATFVHLGLVAALLAAIFQFPRHVRNLFLCYLLFSARLAVGNALLMLTLTEVPFCVLRTTSRARPFHVFTRDEV